MDNLNLQQRAAAEYSGRHLLVLAGAGTGKTRTIIARAKHLILSGTDPKRILILSFTRKSANEIVERIATELQGTKAEGLTGQTFHSWAMSVIKTYSHIFPQSSYTLLDEDDQISCFKLLCGKKWKAKDSEGKHIKPEMVQEVYSYAVNARCSLSDAIRMRLYDNAPASKNVDSERSLLQGIIAMYLEYKKSRHYMDYDDILLALCRYLNTNPELARVVAGAYDHILIDEMQDTNPLQYELLSSFYPYCHLFCVGDDAQSIYAFRGADFKSVHRFTEVVPEAEIMKLTLNYRSTQEILDLSNWLLRTSPLDYSKELQAVRGSGQLPKLIHWGGEREEANDIAAQMLDGVRLRGLEWSDFLVLSRSLYGLKKVESAMIKNKIPYTIYGGRSIMASRHIRDIVAPMRIVSNYLDEIAWSRYLQLWEGIGPVKAASIIGKIVETKSLEDSIELLSSQNLRDEITETLRRISDCHYNPSAAISAALEVMNQRLREIYGDEWSWRKDDFPVLKDVATASGSIGEFISEYVLDPKLETSGKEGSKVEDHVILSTIHSAKGLEADTVFIINASVFTYPTQKAILCGEDAIEEERRCLYVAMTRAKNNLLIYRNVKSLHVSDGDDSHYFLNRVPDSLYLREIIAKGYVDINPAIIADIKRTDIYDDFNFN